MPFAARLRLALFGIDASATSFARRGFHAGPAQTRLEAVGQTFVRGYREALAAADHTQLIARLATVAPADRGFAYEGAAMAFALLDQLTPWRRDRWSTFVRGAGAPHTYMVHIGAGLAYARCRRRLPPLLPRFDPVLCWLVADGYGFHEGFFHGRRSIGAQTVARHIAGYTQHAFDQGLGRSLWFVSGGEPERAAAHIACFAPARQRDLWSGLGLASAYAGGIDSGAHMRLHELAAGHRAHFAQGVAFACAARARAGNPADCTELAARALGHSQQYLGEITESARHEHVHGAASTADLPQYEGWRARVRCALEGA